MKMISFVLSIVLLFVSTLRVVGQNTEELDRKFGFQKFKFNTPVSNYSSFNPQKIDDEKYELGNVITVMIGEFEVEKIDLFFRQNNLFKIKVQLDDLKRTKNTEIYNTLNNIYGRPSSSNAYSTYDGRSQQTDWEGKDVTLKYTLSSFREGGALQTKIFLEYSIHSVKKSMTTDL